ncbi:MAG TPA: COX15/CtaA family protein [Bryobacteraceae bacterium]|nr:COX15/CtaA family protein [Bryobacteraceae bacterium]
MPIAVHTPASHPTTPLTDHESRTFGRFAAFVLAWTALVALEGGLVRATGSGAGCGNNWPLCNGQVVFGTPALATIIEFAHRSLTGIDSALIVALVVWAFRLPRGHGARLASTLSAVFLVTEALIGAALVKFGLVVNDASVARGVVLSIHLTNTLTLLACLTLALLWSFNGPPVRVPPKGWISLAAVLLLEMTGSLAALADTLYPVHSLSAGLAQDFQSGANFSVRLRAIHPFLAVAVGLWLIWYAKSRFRDTLNLSTIVMAAVVAQLFAGIFNLLLLVPVWTQMIHLLLAYAVWIALVALCWQPMRGPKPA